MELTLSLNMRKTSRSTTPAGLRWINLAGTIKQKSATGLTRRNIVLGRQSKATVLAVTTSAEFRLQMANPPDTVGAPPAAHCRRAGSRWLFRCQPTRRDLQKMKICFRFSQKDQGACSRVIFDACQHGQKMSPRHNNEAKNNRLVCLKNTFQRRP